MKINEAVAYDKQIWEDIAQIPSTGTQDRYLSLVEQTGEYHEAQVGITGLARLYAGINGLLISKQLNIDPSDIPASNPDTEMESVKVLAKEDIADQFCEPLEDWDNNPYYLEVMPISKEDISRDIDDIYKKYSQIKKDTRTLTRNLGPKKASKVINRESKYLNQIFYDQDGKHVLQLISLESINLLFQEVYTRQNDQTRQQSERDLYTEIGQNMLKSAEKYIADHADELVKNKQFLKELILEYAIGDMFGNEYFDVSEHFLLSYYSSISSPEQAVERGEAILEAVTNLYMSRLAICFRTFKLLLNGNDFFQEVPYIENLIAACESYHKPELQSRAILLSQYPMKYFYSNVGYNLSDTRNFTKLLTVKRSSQIELLNRRTKEEGMRVDPNYSEKARLFIEDREKILEVTEVYGNGSLTEEAYDQYIAMVGEPGPEFNIVFGSTNKLKQDYEENIGLTYILGDPKVGILIFNDRYSLDFVFKTDLSVEEKLDKRRKLTEQIIQMRSSLNPESSYLTEIVASLEPNEYKDKLPFVLRPSRIAIGSFSHDLSSVNGGVYLRKRTLYDNEHTSPLTDFEFSGFKTNLVLPQLSESLKHIDQYKTRFIPRRGIEVVINDQNIIKSGLSKLIIRATGINRLAVFATIHNVKRTFQIKDNHFFNKNGFQLIPDQTENSNLFSCYIMSAISAWMCRPKIETNEGVVVEGGHNSPIKGGYFSYLRIREHDGYRYKRNDVQWYLCAEEKGLDLDQENIRLMAIDPSGKKRNSTYVREHADDGEQLPPLKVYL